MTGKKAALKTVQMIQNCQPIVWIPIGVISTITKFVILDMSGKPLNKYVEFIVTNWLLLLLQRPCFSFEAS